MSTNESVEKALSLIEGDKSKVLGLNVGGHIVEPGQYIPKAGNTYDIPQNPTANRM